MIDYHALWRRAEQHAASYADAKPFPHVVLDDFLPTDALQETLDAFPPVDSGNWWRNENEHTTAKSVTKFGTPSATDLWWNEPAKRIFTELMGAPFLQFIRILTGVDHPLPDPYFQEGGFHIVGNGGKLDPHADFSHHQTGLERRINLLLYLNADWKPEYGGALKLYDVDVNQVVSVDPVMNRCVIFNTSDISYHGHPEPMTLPDGVYRRSLALYYYSYPTIGRVKKRIVFPVKR